MPHSPMGVRGRGSGINPANRFEDQRYLVNGDFLDELREAGQLSNQHVATMVFDDATRSILNPVDSPDLHFKWTVNPYRGCEHGCIYCYARPGHEYLGLSCGLDFETKVFAKREAPALLRRELSKKSWQGETIMMSGVTDCYQPLEAEFRLTRQCLEVMLEFRQSVSIITKSSLIVRDLDILQEMARLNLVHAAVSVTTLDNRLAGAMEPRAASPRARLDTVRELARAGVPTCVMTAPIVPGLNDHEIPSLLREASRAGAGAAGYVLLRLPHQIKDLFLEWLQRTVPQRAAKVEALVRDTRDGALYNAEWRVRQRGEGAVADAIRATFHTFRKKYKLAERLLAHDTSLFRRPDVTEPGQLGLFGG
ncbi:MAG: PA0069 family radical SAM protein [Phycisphaerales bacterium]